MNKLLFSLLSAAFASTAALAVPEVSNVVFSQPPAGGTATISYSLQNGPAVITVDIRTNGVSIGEQNFANVSGDVNCKVTGNATHQIRWKPHKSWPGHTFAGGVDAVVTAWSLDNPPDYMVVDLANATAAPRYYVSTNAIPGGLFGNDVYRTSMLVMRKINAAGVPWTKQSGNCYHTVTLTNDYYIGVFEFTQGQHYTLFQYWPSCVCTYAPDRAMRPIDDAMYGTYRGWGGHYWPADPDPDSLMSKLRQLRGQKFDYPSEAQWEYACQAGQGVNRYGDGSPIGAATDVDAALDRLGRYRHNGGWWQGTAPSAADLAAVPASVGGTAIVGSYAPNAWGLYDMHGNVSEWCLDGYDESSVIVNYAGDVNVDATSTDNFTTKNGSSCERRVVKGGSYWWEASTARTDHREAAQHNYGGWVHGFRVVCPVDVP